MQIKYNGQHDQLKVCNTLHAVTVDAYSNDDLM